MRQIHKLALLVLVITSTSACSILRDPRDAPWDPRPGRALHEQLPNWDHPMGTKPNYRPDGF